MKTKEQLQKENASLEALIKQKNESLDWWNERERKLRDNFTKVLAQPSRFDDRYDIIGRSSSDPLTWYQIFCQIGKLLMCNESPTWREETQRQLADLQNRISQFDDPTHHISK